MNLLRVACLSLIVSLTPVIAFAACEPTADACAPKKELGAWEKSLAFGFNLTNGNSETLLATMGASIKKETADDLIDASVAVGYGEDSTGKTSDQDDVTRNDVRAAAGYRYLLSDRAYVGAGLGFLYDDIADVDYRSTVSPLGGYYLLKDADFRLAVEAGPSYTFEKVGGETDSYFSPRVADRFEWIISCTSKLFQNAELLFDVSDSENYLLNAEVGVEAAISTNLALVLTVRDSYDHLPAAGREKNDVQVISSLKVAL